MRIDSSGTGVVNIFKGKFTKKFSTLRGRGHVLWAITGRKIYAEKVKMASLLALERRGTNMLLDCRKITEPASFNCTERTKY